jgi:hypothetical protein
MVGWELILDSHAMTAVVAAANWIAPPNPRRMERSTRSLRPRQPEKTI